MSHPKFDYRELARFSDAATPFDIRNGQRTTLVTLIKSGEERRYQVDSYSGRITALHRDGLQFSSIKSLLASVEFADLRAFADTQRRLLSNKNLDQMIEPSGVFDPDGIRERLTLEKVRREFDIRSEPAVSVLMIDGAAGVGKTSLIERMVFERACDASSTPILHITSRGRRLSNLPDAIGKTASDLDARFRADQIPTLVRQGALQLAIDGFDELVQPDGYGNAWGALKDLLRQVESGGPIILAGRDTFFDQQDVQAQFQRMASNVNLRMIRLQEADMSASITWLEQQGWDPAELRSPPVRSFLERRYTRRPFFLSQIAPLKSFNNIAIEQGSPQEILIDRLLSREADLMCDSMPDMPENSSERVEQLKSALTNVCMEIAQDMAEREADTISLDFLELVSELEFSAIVDADSVAAFVRKAASMAFLERSEVKQESRFPHSEFQNHFLARALLKALVANQVFPALRNASFGMDMIEAFADAFRPLPDNEASAVRESLRKLAFEERFLLQQQSNAAALLVASLVHDAPFDPKLEIASISINECRVFEKLSSAQIVDCSINRLDARGADLSDVEFSRSNVASLIVDSTTNFGMTWPSTAILQIDDNGQLHPEHDQTKIEGWIRGASAQSALNAELSWQDKNLPLVRYFERLCRRFMRQHYIRDSDRDDASFLLKDEMWPIVRGVLQKHDRLVEETKAASGAADKFYRVTDAASLLNPEGNADSLAVRKEIAAVARSET